MLTASGLFNRLNYKIFDNGKGIEQVNQEKVFDAGFTTKKKGQGTGLGLAICKKIIEKHQGNIEFESTKDFQDECFKTVFAISIPIF